MDGSPGKIIDKPCSVHYSNVMLIGKFTIIIIKSFYYIFLYIIYY